MNVGDDRPYTVSRVMRINPDGSHFLSNDSDPKNPETGIKFFPNPTSGILYIDVPVDLLDSLIEVRVFSLLGKEIYYKEIKSTDPIDLSGIQNGLYLLNLIGNGESYSEKLIVID